MENPRFLKVNPTLFKKPRYTPIRMDRDHSSQFVCNSSNAEHK